MGKNMLIDGRVGLDGTHFTREDLMVNVAQPIELSPGVSRHIRLHVGKNGCSKATRVDAREPFGHFLIDVAPHLHIQSAEFFNVLGIDSDAHPSRKLGPIGICSEIASIVRIARGTIDGQKLFRVNAEHTRHAGESVRGRAGAEDFAVVEDDGANLPGTRETWIALVGHRTHPWLS